MESSIHDLLLPPRYVPFLVRWRIWFGGGFNQVGWLILGFGMSIFWALVMNGDYSFLTFRGEIDTIEGKITASQKTNFTVGGSKNRPGTPVYANFYAFTLDDGQNAQKYEGVSYAVGQRLERDGKVTIEYLAANPTKSRIQGMRRAPLHPVAALAIILPLVGLCFLIAGWKRASQANYLLINGIVGSGKLLSKEPTHTIINGQPVYKYTFEFPAADGKTYQATAKTHHRNLLEGEEKERVLYHPFDPSYAVMLDALPGSPKIDQSGDIQVGSLLTTLAVTILPALVLGGQALYLSMRFG